MIDGVKIKDLVVHLDVHAEGEEVVTQPGILMEVLRQDDNLLKQFGQSIFTTAYQGTIKAFHWHEKQDDLWFVATGKALIVLYDTRQNSPTYQQTQVITAGVDNYKLVLIPTGVAHGYKVLSQEPVLLFYHVTQVYNPQDEHRIPYNDPTINFNWNKYN